MCKSINKCGAVARRLYFVWVPGHCQIVGNELADKVAGKSNMLEQKGVACFRSSVKFKVKDMLKKDSWKHERCEAVYGEHAIGCGERMG